MSVMPCILYPIEANVSNAMDTLNIDTNVSNTMDTLPIDTNLGTCAYVSVYIFILICVTVLFWINCMSCTIIANKEIIIIIFISNDVDTSYSLPTKKKSYLDYCQVTNYMSNKIQ